MKNKPSEFTFDITVSARVTLMAADYNQAVHKLFDASHTGENILSGESIEMIWATVDTVSTCPDLIAVDGKRIEEED